MLTRPACERFAWSLSGSHSRLCVNYVELNPEKEGLALQRFPFVPTYNNWPFHKPR